MHGQKNIKFWTCIEGISQYHVNVSDLEKTRLVQTKCDNFLFTL